MKIVRFSRENISIGVFSDKNISDFEYANVVVLLNEDPAFLNPLSDSVDIFG